MNVRAWIRSRRALAVAASVAVAAVATGVSLASIPSEQGTITACYHKNSGDLRVIDPDSGGSCLPSEYPITWSDGQSGKVADADLLDGIDSTQLLLHCPSGYTRSRDVCFSPRRTGNFSTAWFYCLNSGGRLPNTSELAQAFPALVVAGGVPAEEDWTSDMTAGDHAMAVSVSGFTVWWTDRAMADVTGYRCILSPTNEGTPSLTASATGEAGATAAAAPRARRARRFVPQE